MDDLAHCSPDKDLMTSKTTTVEQMSSKHRRIIKVLEDQKRTLAAVN